MTRRFEDSWGRTRNTALFLGVVLALLAVGGEQRLNATLNDEAGANRDRHEAFLVPRASALRLVGLGHDELMADFVWLRALSYFAVQFEHRKRFEWLDRYIDTIIELDPDFKGVYHWAGVAVVYGGGQITNERIMASNRFLERGRERFPDDWLINFMLGINYTYELSTDDPDAAAAYKLLGASYLLAAAEQPEAPHWLSLTAGHHLNRQGAGDEAVAILSTAFLETRGALTATAATEEALYRHYPNYGRQAEMSTLTASGLALQRRLSTADWWHLLQYRRGLTIDLNTESGYLPWELRVLLRSEHTERVGGGGTTPFDNSLGLILNLMRNETPWQ